jgi:hypothetical protein
MASPLSIHLPKNVLIIVVVGSSEILLAWFCLLPAAHAEASANTPAGAMVPFVAADSFGSVLAHQRSGITVAAMLETASHEYSVTLWDELARPAPAPLPVPINTAMSNAVRYTRSIPLSAFGYRGQTRIRSRRRSKVLKHASRITQIDQTTGAGNGTANRFVLRPPAGTFFLT